MLVLLQLVKLFGAEEIGSWCELIKQDVTEAYEFNDVLNDNGVELSESQFNSLIRVIQNGSYKSALRISAVA